MADEQGPGINTNPGPRNADRRQKGLRRELSRAVAVRRIPSFSTRCKSILWIWIPIETVGFAGLAKD